MKYLLDFLSTDPEAPKVQDGAFQQLLVDVHAGKSQSRSNDQFYESLEKIVNELRSAPEALIFLKPVSKKDAPDYAEVIKHPMDLSTVLRNVKAQKYKSKATFGRDLDLIWENCLIYNAMEGHPLRATAKYMRAKADHHLAYLQDRVDRGPNMALQFPGLAGSPAPSVSVRYGLGGASRGEGTSANGLDEDEDAAGEDEDEDVNVGDGALLQPGGSSVTRIASAAPLPFRDDRPDLTPNLEIYSSLSRTPAAMAKYSSISLNQAGPSYAEKGKAREVTSGSTVPSWYATTDEDVRKAEGNWWGAISKDEAYTGGLPATSSMSTPTMRPYKRIPKRLLRRKSLVNPSNQSTVPNGTTTTTPYRRTIHLERLVHESVEELGTARRIANSIHDWQRIEAEGGALPPIERFDREQAMRKEEEAERKRDVKEEKREAIKRRKLGGEVGEREAAIGFKRATAGMLAHAGFDGANEGALDLLTRVATEHMRNVGRTFRLLMDGFSQKMSFEEIVLHSLFENGLVRPSDLESHIKDDIEREGAKVAEMTRKVKQAYIEVTTAPVIEDDMMFAEGAEMLTDGNFADELGEDFLGLRDLGVAREHGMTNLTVPSNLFYGRKKRVVDAAANGKADTLDFTPPPPFVPLSPTTYQTQLPALLHTFFAARLEAGLGLEDSPNFEASHAVIGSLGQVSVKAPVVASGPKKKIINGDGSGGEKKKPAKKPAAAGVGKGNWIRPSKEEKARKEAAKNALLAAQAGNGAPPIVNGQIPPPIPGLPVTGEEEDAEGEEE